MILREALQEMRSTDHKGNAIPFDVVFTTYDRKGGTGGSIVSLTGVTVKLKKSSKQKEKSANHDLNGTINFYLPNGHIRKAHIKLITHFNNQPVL